jgi:uncharacterized protein
MREIHAALSINTDPLLIQAALPLFEGEEVDALEWSFDTAYKQPVIPEWFEDLLKTYGSAGRLVGHGVYFSLFSGKWLPEQAEWLEALRDLTQRFRFDHISEHFGFLTGADFHKGAPLAVPYTAATLAIGRDRLMRLADAAGCPVGLENLAFSTDVRSVCSHGAFLEDLLEPVDGFLVLDLHNFYCHVQNFRMAHQLDLLKAYPLHRVREIHISGGSWEPSAFRELPGVRRDTHDDRVPEAVFELLEIALPLCPALKYVVMEQLTHALGTEEEQEGFRADFRRCRGMIQAFLAKGLGQAVVMDFAVPSDMGIPIDPPEDLRLYQEQRVLSEILEQCETFEGVREALSRSVLAGSEWRIEDWDLAMLETAWQIARKWRDGF